MGKIFTTETTDTINVAMAVEPRCYDDRYVTEVQSADLKVWNEGTRLFCSVKSTLEIVDTENPRNTCYALVRRRKSRSAVSFKRHYLSRYRRLCHS